MIEIDCLRSNVKSAFCHSISRMCGGNPLYVPIHNSELFPITIECVCGFSYIVSDEKNIPLASKRCSCGTYLIKYNFYTVQ